MFFISGYIKRVKIYFIPFVVWEYTIQLVVLFQVRNINYCVCSKY